MTPEPHGSGAPSCLAPGRGRGGRHLVYCRPCTQGSSTSSWASGAQGQLPGASLTPHPPRQALLLLGTATLALGAGPGLTCIAAQMVHHGLFPELPAAWVSVPECGRGHRGCCRASGGKSHPSPRRSRVCWFGVKRDSGLEANCPALCPQLRTWNSCGFLAELWEETSLPTRGTPHPSDPLRPPKVSPTDPPPSHGPSVGGEEWAPRGRGWSSGPAQAPEGTGI